ncbi:MAG: bifunctional demethylmenaquinone methyltransferase/2-methoxy-6-polyprenyl-1,4-benzoquinol methylase UbiE [Gammaproteobacteria bacterium]|nr:bifunctional demethylmenaquinone methyltransferase/2-methoxy-6-polyprenyl-1,4-benzoquinol methylase UbiE [Gammaproteobacteria bacterium]
MNNTDSKDQTTHFGYEKVSVDDKTGKVFDVFQSVASRYDIMNDLMSLGVHRLWKWFTCETSGIRPGQRILDLAGGTGDIAMKLSDRVGVEGEVVIADINDAMLINGRSRLTDKGYASNIKYVQANAEVLPFPDNYFHAVTISFGLRNVTHIDVALKEMFRVLQAGGQLIVLEFSKPKLPLLKQAYDFYSFNILPVMGKVVANDEKSYRYLAESIRMHPDQDKLKQMILDAGFNKCEYHNMTGGIVALHKARKF